MRDIKKQPFTPESPWNLPLPVAVAYEAENSGTTLSVAWDTSATNKGYWINQDRYSHTVVEAKATLGDPVVTVYDRNDPSGRSVGLDAGVRIPTDALAAPGSDGHLHVDQPGSSFVIELIGARKIDDGAWSVSRIAFVDHAGDGLGPKDDRATFTNGLYPNVAGNGTRATGGSALACLVRKHELLAVEAWVAAYLAGQNPDPYGVIPHPIAIGLRASQLRWVDNTTDEDYGYFSGGSTSATGQPGWPVGTPRAGFGRSLGYRWPASEQDYDGKVSYTGQSDTTPGTGVPMGALLGIPDSVDIYDVPTPYLVPFMAAANRHGAYVLDRAGDAVLFFEAGSSSATRSALLASNAAPVRSFFQALRVVVGNTSTTPGGQPLSADRRAPLAEPLEASTVTALYFTTLDGADGAALPAEWVPGITPSVGTDGGATIQGGRARLRAPSHTTGFQGTGAVSRRISGVTPQDFSLYCEVEFARTGDGAPAQIYGRANSAVDTGTGYYAQFGDSSGTEQLRIRRTVSYTGPTLATVDYAWTSGVVYATRFEMFGADLRLKVWPLGEPEPEEWTLTATDTNPIVVGTSGNEGAIGFRQGHGVAGATQDLFVDNVEISDEPYVAPEEPPAEEPLLGRYDFVTLAATDVADGVTFSAFGTAGGRSIPVIVDGLGTPGEPVAEAVVSLSGRAATHQVLSDSIEFTVTPDPGQEVTLTALTGVTTKGGSAGIRGWRLYSSVDGYAQPLLSVDSIPTIRPELHAFTADLSALAPITAPVTFRWYFFCSSTVAVQWDQIALRGTATAAAGSAPDLSGTIVRRAHFLDPRAAGAADYSLVHLSGPTPEQIIKITTAGDTSTARFVVILPLDADTATTVEITATGPGGTDVEQYLLLPGTGGATVLTHRQTYLAGVLT